MRMQHSAHSTSSTNRLPPDRDRMPEDRRRPMAVMFTDAMMMPARHAAGMIPAMDRPAPTKARYTPWAGSRTGRFWITQLLIK